MSTATTVAKLKFQDEREQVVENAECTLCEKRYAHLISDAMTYTYSGALGLIAAHLEVLHPEIGAVDYENFGLVRPALPDGTVELSVVTK